MLPVFMMLTKQQNFNMIIFGRSTECEAIIIGYQYRE